MMNGWLIFNSRFSDVGADLRITAPTRPPELITVALVKSMLVFIPIHICIYYTSHVSEASQNLVVASLLV